MEQRKYPFSWEPGWSFSRMNTLRSCLRMYWYEYYAKRFAPGHEKNLILELQQLSRVPFELGNAVHQTIAEILKELQINGNVIGLADAKEMAVNKFEILVRNKPLIEKRLGISLTDGEREKVHGQIKTSMTTFFGSKWLSMMQDMPPGVRNKWLIDPPGYGEFRIEGKKAYAKPDLVFGYRDGRYYLVEWKSGKPHRDQNIVQVQAYLFYANDVMGIPLESTVGVVQYLTYPSEKPIEVEGRLVNPLEMKNKILSELKLIESKCEDVANNIPRPITHFARTEELGYCELCKYREICRPDFKNEKGAAPFGAAFSETG
jgi:CRISPR/Cas system-associated exonuclease Cas4 (RecB family)/citrate lyase gamma subunit